jgi:hypothetical protein
MKSLNLVTLFAVTAMAIVSSSPSYAIDLKNIKVGGVTIEIGKKKDEPASAPVKQETCQVKAFGQTFFGTDTNKGVAKRKAIEECQKKYHGMHCDEAKCDD